jgi:hypothetical protein
MEAMKRVLLGGRHEQEIDLLGGISASGLLGMLACRVADRGEYLGDFHRRKRPVKREARLKRKRCSLGDVGNAGNRLEQSSCGRKARDRASRSSIGVSGDVLQVVIMVKAWPCARNRFLGHILATAGDVV